ncbi:MAG TPA: hypothetical protein VGG45_16210 [Terracidiphilus sp.]|jgi:hypothetical protein
MANVLAPSGFRYIGLVDGSSPNFGIATGFAAYNASAMYAGDPLVLSGGLLVPASTTGNTGAAIAGVAVSFKWVSTTFQQPVWRPYYPGSDSVSNANVDVRYVNNAGAIFEVQVSSSSAGTAVGGPAVQADVGSFFNFATGAGGSAATGQSSFSLDYSTKNATKGVLPFYLYSLESAPRTDPATAGNLVRVGISTLTLAG